MKWTAARARSVTATYRQIVALMASARQFVPQDRGEAMLRKWLSHIDIRALGEDRMVAVMADATLLAADLLLSYPAASGATAFDRLARSRAGAPAAEAALITALRQARFRLLRVSDAHADAVTAHDVLSGNARADRRCCVAIAGAWGGVVRARGDARRRSRLFPGSDHAAGLGSSRRCA